MVHPVRERCAGYQVLGRSSGICESAALAFSRLAPSHGSLQEESRDASSLSFFPVSNDRWAISRSVYGGPEYSGRGMQVVTMALLLDRDQLASYDYQPTHFIRTAIALGHLTLPLAIQASLPIASLPRRPFGQREVHAPVDAVSQVVQHIEAEKKVCVLSCGDPTWLPGGSLRLFG